MLSSVIGTSSTRRHGPRQKWSYTSRMSQMGRWEDLPPPATTVNLKPALWLERILNKKEHNTHGRRINVWHVPCTN